MIKAEIVADSLSPQGDRLISVLVTMPRIILSEMNTHRMLSKNTSSSRAIPFKKMVEAVQNDPFIPIAWQKDHKGMQRSEYFNEEESKKRDAGWWVCKEDAIASATMMYEQGVTKQLCNRLLEPFMWTTMLITGSKEGWDNFFSLRLPEYHYGHEVTNSKKEMISLFKNGIYEGYEDNLKELESYTDLDWLRINKGQAEIHMMALVEAIYDDMNKSTPKQLKAGEWHIPFEDTITEKSVSSYLEGIMDIRKDGLWGDELIQKTRIKISTAMAARTSYTVVGNEKEVDYQKMIELHNRLIAQNPPHSSPMEHCARTMNDEEYKAYTKTIPVDEETNDIKKVSLGWCRNFKGFISYRHIIESNKN